MEALLQKGCVQQSNSLLHKTADQLNLAIYIQRMGFLRSNIRVRPKALCLPGQRAALRQQICILRKARTHRLRQKMRPQLRIARRKQLLKRLGLEQPVKQRRSIPCICRRKLRIIYPAKGCIQIPRHRIHPFAVPGQEKIFLQVVRCANQIDKQIVIRKSSQIQIRTDLRRKGCIIRRAQECMQRLHRLPARISRRIDFSNVVPALPLRRRRCTAAENIYLIYARRQHPIQCAVLGNLRRLALRTLCQRINALIVFAEIYLAQHALRRWSAGITEQIQAHQNAQPRGIGIAAQQHIIIIFPQAQQSCLALRAVRRFKVQRIVAFERKGS